ncbi:MAG TPA: fatty acid desaturase [Thermoleophilaceae bacterium]|jgi:omega-6 fatty acid desaturase (delta-12 desaturase)
MNESAAPTIAAPSAASATTRPRRARERPFWRDAIAPYEKADLRRSAIDIATSLVPYLALSVAMYLLVDVSYLLVLALAVPASGFLLRTYIVFHDCSHGSFLPTKRANMAMGVLAGLVVYSPFHAWKHEHAVHHATSSDLDRRGVGDVDMLTVREYHELSLAGRLGYRLVRNPLVMLGLGPIWALAIEPRFNQGNGRPLDRRSVIYTDMALVVLLGALIWTVGWKAYLMVQLPTIMMAGAAGVWLFYVQHQFEGAYWQRGDDWSYADAALKGSSYLKLPKVLQFFSGNIGLHHVHHLSARIPNYNLQRAHDENPFFHDVPTITLWDGIKALRLKLWDEESARLVTFAGARRAVRSRS